MPFGLVGPGETGKSFPWDQRPSQSVTIQYKGPFDYQYIFRTLDRWFEQRRFKFRENRVKDSGKRIKCDWAAERRINEYYSEDYTIKVDMWNLTSQEIVVNGEPRKILNGMIQFEIKGAIDTDVGEFFQEGKFRKLLGKIMRDVTWGDIQSKYIDVMEYRTQDIQTLLKECLNMTTKENAAW